MVGLPTAFVASVTVVPLTLIVGAEGLVPCIVIVFDVVRLVPEGAAGVPPLTGIVTVSVN